jgi:hypothetical protein
MFTALLMRFSAFGRGGYGDLLVALQGRDDRWQSALTDFLPDPSYPHELRKARAGVQSRRMLHTTHHFS